MSPGRIFFLWSDWWTVCYANNSPSYRFHLAIYFFLPDALNFGHCYEPLDLQQIAGQHCCTFPFWPEFAGAIRIQPGVASPEYFLMDLTDSFRCLATEQTFILLIS